MKYTKAQKEAIQKYESLSANLTRLEDSMQSEELTLLERNDLEHALDMLLCERDDIRMEYLEILSGS